MLRSSVTHTGALLTDVLDAIQQATIFFFDLHIAYFLQRILLGPLLEERVLLWFLLAQSALHTLNFLSMDPPGAFEILVKAYFVAGADRPEHSIFYSLIYCIL